jgi:hypothetical protein
MRAVMVLPASPAADLLAEDVRRERAARVEAEAALSALVEHMRRPAAQGQTVGAYRLGLAFAKAERVVGQGGAV